MKTLCLLTILIFTLPNVHASKIRYLKEIIEVKCGNIHLSKKDYIIILRKSFLTCRPREDIEVASNCYIKCLKKNRGNIIGNKP